MVRLVNSIGMLCFLCYKIVSFVISNTVWNTMMVNKACHEAAAEDAAGNDAGIPAAQQQQQIVQPE